MQFTLDSNTIGFILGLLGIIGWLTKLGNRVGSWEEKLKHTDDFVTDMRRIFITNSLLDAQRRGVLQTSSPLRPNAEILKSFGDLGVRIVAYYNSNGLATQSDDVVIFRFWRAFGSDLVAFARNLNLNLSDALASALYLCREGEV